MLDLRCSSSFVCDLLPVLLKHALNLRRPPSRNVVSKDEINLLERLSLGLRIHEEDVEGHGKAEDTEDDVSLPSNVGECWGDEEGESEIEAKKA